MSWQRVQVMIQLDSQINWDNSTILDQNAFGDKLKLHFVVSEVTKEMLHFGW